MSDERRKSPRFPADAGVEVRTEDGVAAGRLRDICREAALVESTRAWPAGTVVELSVDLGGGPLAVAGTVIRLAEGGDAPSMAILFDSLPPAVATAIDLYIARQA